MGIDYKSNCVLNSSNAFAKLLCGNSSQQTMLNWSFIALVIVIVVILVLYLLSIKRLSFKEYLKIYIPSIKSIVVSLVIWGLLEIVFTLVFGVCIYGDCINNGQMANCCSKTRSNLAEFMFALKSFYTFPVIAYLLGSFLTQYKITGKK